MKEFQLKPDDIFCHNLRFSFAASVWQIFAPLYLGATLVIYPEAVMMNTYELFKRVKHNHITKLEVVPSVLNSYLNCCRKEKRR